MGFVLLSKNVEAVGKESEHLKVVLDQSDSVLVGSVDVDAGHCRLVEPDILGIVGDCRVLAQLCHDVIGHVAQCGEFVEWVLAVLRVVGEAVHAQAGQHEPLAGPP